MRGFPSVGGGLSSRQRRAVDGVCRALRACRRLALLGILVALLAGLVALLAGLVATRAGLVAALASVVSLLAGFVALLADLIATIGGLIATSGGLIAFFSERRLGPLAVAVDRISQIEHAPTMRRSV